MTEHSFDTGFNTWASSPPKDYTAHYLVAAGPRQLVVVDDILPLAYYDRTEVEQGRMTGLAVEFVRSVQNAIGFQESSDTHVLSNHADLDDLMDLTRNLDVSQLRRSMPKEKRQGDEVPSLPDHLHPLVEYLAYDYMRSLGVRTILRGSGQLALTQGYPHREVVNFTFLQPGDNLETIGLSHGLDQPTIERVIEKVHIWEQAGLLKQKSLVKKDPTSPSTPHWSTFIRDDDGSSIVLTNSDYSVVASRHDLGKDTKAILESTLTTDGACLRILKLDIVRNLVSAGQLQELRTYVSALRNQARRNELEALLSIAIS